MVRCSSVRLFVTCSFRCVHKRIANIIKVYIEMNNMQVELIRFHTKMTTLFVYVCESSDSMFTAYSLDGSTHSLTALKVNILHQYKDNMHAIYMH